MIFKAFFPVVECKTCGAVHFAIVRTPTSTNSTFQPSIVFERDTDHVALSAYVATKAMKNRTIVA